jgi:nucleotide-binding universal stress UspA family protein
MGTHGRHGVTHLVMGSDAENVVKSSTVPVLVVRQA